MQDRHKDRRKYFNEQVSTTRQYVLPYLSGFLKTDAQCHILEIGCGEGGNMLPFLEEGCHVTGIDINEKKIRNAEEFLAERNHSGQFRLLAEDIYKCDLAFLGKFDLIIMRDVIEHIHDQDKFLAFIRPLLKPDGIIFFGFPPWRMPFGGHQQTCQNPFLSVLPWFHLLPTVLYKSILKIFGESQGNIRSLVEIKETGISIGQFERLLTRNNYTIKEKDFYFINPNYKVKFGLNPRKVFLPLAKIPWIRDFYTTCAYYVVSS